MNDDDETERAQFTARLHFPLQRKRSAWALNVTCDIRRAVLVFEAVDLIIHHLMSKYHH